MARFKVSEEGNYGSQGATSYFKLADDHDSARVRFLLNDIEDLQGLSVHKVNIGGRERYVNCLHKYGNPKDDCPLCQAGHPVLATYFIPLYNEDAKQVQIWKRGKGYGSRMQGICSRNPNLVTHGFEIERRGKQGDTKTEYDIWEIRDMEDESISLSDFEIPDPLGTIVLDKSYEDMQEFLRKGEFPQVGGQSRNVEDDRPIRRQSSSRTDRF